MFLTVQPTFLATAARFFAIPASTGAAMSCVTKTIVFPDSAFGPVNGPVHSLMPAWILTRSAFAFATPGASALLFAWLAVAATVTVKAAAKTMKIGASLNRPCDLITLLPVVVLGGQRTFESSPHDRGSSVHAVSSRVTSWSPATRKGPAERAWDGRLNPAVHN